MKRVAPNPVDPDESYESALRLRQKETGKWFLTSIKRALKNLPNSLDATYERVLSGILSKAPAEAGQVKVVLPWLVGSHDLLTLDELAEAVSIESQATKLNRDMIVTDPEDLVALCRSIKSLTPLHIAAENAMEEMVEILLRHQGGGIEPQFSTHYGRSTSLRTFYRACQLQEHVLRTRQAPG
jgi:hypothetical protein